MKLFLVLLRSPPPIDPRHFEEAVLLIAIYLAALALLPTGFSPSPLALSISAALAWRIWRRMPGQVARHSHLRETTAGNVLGFGFIFIGPFAGIFLLDHPAILQRLIFFSVLPICWRTTRYLMGKQTPDSLMPLECPKGRPSHCAHAAKIWLALVVWGLLSNELAIATLNEASWLGFRAALPIAIELFYFWILATTAPRKD